MEKGRCLEGRGMLSIFLALNWRRLRLGPVEGRKQEWGWQKRLCFLIRKKGSRTKGEGPSLTQPVGIPISSSCLAVPLAQPCRSILGQLEDVGWAWAQRPDDWTGATWATSPGLKEWRRTSCVQPGSLLPITVFGVKTG